FQEVSDRWSAPQEKTTLLPATKPQSAMTVKIPSSAACVPEPAEHSQTAESRQEMQFSREFEWELRRLALRTPVPENRSQNSGGRTAQLVYRPSVSGEIQPARSRVNRCQIRAARRLPVAWHLPLRFFRN